MANNSPTNAQLNDGTKWEIPAAEALASVKWPGATIVQNPPYSEIDLGVVLNGKLVAQLEVKRRYQDIGKYDTTMVTWTKHDVGRFYRKYFKAHVFCLLVFDDAVAVFDLGDRPDGKEKKGRWDRPGSEREYALYKVEGMERHDDLLPGIKAAVRGTTE